MAEIAQAVREQFFDMFIPSIYRPKTGKAPVDFAPESVQIMKIVKNIFCSALQHDPKKTNIWKTAA